MKPFSYFLVFLMVIAFALPCTSQLSMDAEWEQGEFELQQQRLSSRSLMDNELGIVKNVISATSSNARLIEPTSPILGPALAKFIKEHDGHPFEVVNDIYEQYANIRHEIATSCIAYFNVLMPGLEEYNRSMLVSTKPKTGMVWTQVEPSCIPLEVLMPLHDGYTHLLKDAVKYQSLQGYATSRDSAVYVAKRFWEKKATSSVVMNMLRQENELHDIMPYRLRNLVQLNATISSAEAAYPRLQHSINGYLHHTYSYLIAHHDLDGLLAASYDAEERWLVLPQSEKEAIHFFAYVEDAIVTSGFSVRDALMVLCYSTRNMPNIDIQYADEPDKALLLEVFFWKLKGLQDEAVNNHFNAIFPNHQFKQNPMLYHYATAAYLAYEVKKAGYSDMTSVGMALLSKAGYKFHKFVCALDPREFNDSGFAAVSNMLKRQSSVSGIHAGFYGGKHGKELARQESRTSSKFREVVPVQLTSIKSH